MLRSATLLALALLLAAAPGAAQEIARVRLSVGLSADTGVTRQPIVRTDSLIADPRVASMLASGFPVRMHYRVQVYRSRSGWFDAFVRQTEWDLVVRHEPLLDQYQMAELFRNGQRAYRYADRDALKGGVATPREIRVGPRDPGVYYYVVTLEISTMSGSDIRELERFLSGDVGPAATGSESVGNALGNAIRDALLSVAGLPSLQLEDRSERFTVR
jgi:hypothetical protein